MPILHVQYDAEGLDLAGNKVKIPAPEVMLERGPLVQVLVGLAEDIAQQLVQQGQKVPQPASGVGLIDTGASATCIDDALAQSLGLPVIDVVGMTSASHAGTQANVYPITMEIVGSPIRVNVPRAIGANLAPQGLIALIGRDYLRHCTLVYNGFTGQITLSI